MNQHRTSSQRFTFQVKPLVFQPLLLFPAIMSGCLPAYEKIRRVFKVCNKYWKHSTSPQSNYSPVFSATTKGNSCSCWLRIKPPDSDTSAAWGSQYRLTLWNTAIYIHLPKLCSKDKPMYIHQGFYLEDANLIYWPFKFQLTSCPFVIIIQIIITIIQNTILELRILLSCHSLPFPLTEIILDNSVFIHLSRTGMDIRITEL